MSDEIETVEGGGVRIMFEGQRCIHARNCVLSRPDVFVPNVEGAWIHPENAGPEAAAELAHACPSGAIRYERLDGKAGETAPVVNLLRIRENGPYSLHAEHKIGAADDGFRATLCRCGASKRKPYCDGSHSAAGFTASGECAEGKQDTLAARNGPVEITGSANGPLLVKGPLEIVTGAGHTVAIVSKAFLCRCGQSATKPFCDGTHNKIGFVADGF